MPKPLFPVWQKRLTLIAALGLALTGMGQMPIFSRYYIADLPGLGWLGNYQITAALHLALGAALVFLLTSYAASWLAAGAARPTLTTAGKWRVALYGAVALTGVVRVLQNGSWAMVGPMNVRYLDWLHLALAMGLLVFAMAAGRKGAVAARR
ncbi:hypothetical protein [Solidesulfovibrio carbinolicus]|uniref:FeS-binding protein n=1 Tax=Solidesulfovibrio carbinolicus TaxID=296842 RepID=A0A4P6HMK3_9BACT|nr:hypothetical protein [Solidesulfovibrio carbinolicus]QAZ66328.1 hypothetical protein C3Y92_03340 [Solidesulfovibrio carbinolicus]